MSTDKNAEYKNIDKDAEVDKEVRGESEESQEILPQMEPTDIDPLEP